MIVKGLTVGLLQENCYILGCEQTNEAVIIDPGDSSHAILRLVTQNQLNVNKIINTHAHFDHVMAVNDVRATTGAPFYLHKLELPILRDAPERVQLWLDMEIDPIDEPDELLDHGQLIEFGEQQLEVRFTPGHSPGHVVFIDHQNHQVFGGDTLFMGSIGRYDLPGADGPTLHTSIREQLFSLADDYTVFPGHGPATSIGQERISNPFVGEQAVNQ